MTTLYWLRYGLLALLAAAFALLLFLGRRSDA
ncbi:MAG: hypothetical protein H6Q10_3020 [Acidobacteria bacterium]|nr:hypothetical protein [Acidobacteriota bacterium]